MSGHAQTSKRHIGLVGVITVLFNSDEVLEDYFKSLALQIGIDFNLYVIDNSPTNSGILKSIELAKFHKINLKYIFNDENLGVAKGNNQGIELAIKDNCDWIIFSNNDITFGPDTLDQLLQNTDDSSSAYSPKILVYNSQTIWYAGGKIRKWLAKAVHYGIGAEDNGRFDEINYVDYAPTCFLLMKLDDIHRVGFMDEKYFVYYDDVDFNFRLKAKKIQIKFIPISKVFHKVSHSTGGSESDFTIYYCNRNIIYYVLKNYKNISKIIALTVILCSKLIKLSIINSNQRKILIKGLKDGFNL
jgi:GT2 family glycosyltransferase